MSRDDSLLYTGSSSASFGTTHSDKVRANATEEKREKRSQLLPVGELVKSEIQKEIDALAIKSPETVEALIASGIPHALEIDMLSDAKASQKLTKVQNKLSAMLRKPRVSKSSGVEDE